MSRRRVQFVSPPAFLLLSSVFLASLVAGVCEPGPAHAVAPASSPPILEWRRVDAPISGPLTAVALGSADRRIAVGGEEAVAAREIPTAGLPADGRSGWRRVAVPGVAVDLAYEASGALWAGTTNGLFRIDSAWRREERSPAPGDAARRVHRVVVHEDLVLVATDAGAFASRDGEVWVRLFQGVPSAPVVALAVRSRVREAAGAAGVDVWLVAGARLYRLSIASVGSSVEAMPARRVEITGWPSSQSVVDVVVDVEGAEVVVLFTQSIARLLPTAGDAAALRWEVVHPVLPPGAVSRRMVAAAGRVWLATDRGLLAAAPWPARWQRAAQPAGSAATLALAGTRRQVAAAGPTGLWAGRPERVVLGTRQADPRGVGVIARDPELRRVHEKALERAGLDPAYWKRLRGGLGRRGWLPELSLSASVGYDRDTDHDYDESFTSGQLHRLNDRSSGRSRDFGGSLTLRWDLGDVAYNTEAPDLSREGRQVITLRDTILDEINQLYFDRRRALVALSRFADRRDPEAVALEIRARELAAGLDAWTGGWFSVQLARERRAAGDATREPPARHR